MRRQRNPEATKQAIVEGCLACMAAGGDENVSFQKVSQITGVHRSSIYDYFPTRELLIATAVKWMSDRLYDSVFGEHVAREEGPFADNEILALNERLIMFAMENPDLCRAWLIHVLAMPNPMSDRFWKKYEGEMDRFARSEAAQEGIDAEMLTVRVLAGSFMWPIMARARAKSAAKRQKEARRYLLDSFRNSLYGSSRPEHFPRIAEILKDART